MLVKLADQGALKSPDSLNEIKLDGVRAVAYINGGITLKARSGADITAQFPEVVEGLQESAKSAEGIILDGEIVCFEDGKPNFTRIQRRIHQMKPQSIKFLTRAQPATYCPFDMLFEDFENLMSRCLTDRKLKLNRGIVDSTAVRKVTHIVGNGELLFDRVRENGLEGVVVKDPNSPYVEGKRSDFWQKIKVGHVGTFLACGMTEGTGHREDTFGSLILAERDKKGTLHYVGRVGSGFNESLLAQCMDLPQIADCPLEGWTREKPVTRWLEPLPIKVHYAERTPDNHLRFPSVKEG